MNKKVKGILIILSVIMLIFSCSDPSDVKIESADNDNNGLSDGPGIILSDNSLFPSNESMENYSEFTASGTENSRQNEYINVALDKNAEAKSIYDYAYGPDNVTDGDETTVWGSSSTDSSDPWIYIDLGESMEISGIGLKWYVYTKGEYSKSYHAKRIAIWTSNTEKIEDGLMHQYTEKNGTGNGTDGIQKIISSTSTVTCRYVALNLSERNANINVYALTEFEVYRKNNGISFEDPAFEAAVRTEINKPSGDIIPADLVDVTRLDLKSLGITSLQGIEYFTNLKQLNCDSNQLTSIDISANENLFELFCFDNEISEIDLSKNLNLEILGCAINKLTELDISNNKKLFLIDAGFNNLTVEAVDEIFFHAWDSGITGGEHFSTFGQEPPAIPSNQSLLYRQVLLDREWQMVEIDNGMEVTFADQLFEEKIREITHNYFSLPVYQTDLAGIVRIIANELNISSADEIKYCINLTDLILSDNNLTQLDVSENKVLVNLLCAGNNLTALDLTENINLENLECSNNNIQSLNVSNCTKLKFLNCFNNPSIASISVLNNTELTFMGLANTGLTNIQNLSVNTKLGYIDCRENSLSISAIDHVIETFYNNHINGIARGTINFTAQNPKRPLSSLSQSSQDYVAALKTAGWSVFSD